MRSSLIAAGVAAALGVGAAHAQAAPSDLDALSIADEARLEPAQASSWRAFVEGGALDAWDRSLARAEDGARVSLDAHYEGALAPGFRFIFGDRLDLEELGPPSVRSSINTLKEAYVSWQVNPDESIDVGRINLRFGVATGYNPTDFFRADAIRSIVSIDPSSLRENRQGSVVVESQTLWEGSSFLALVSPRLATTPDTANFSADLGATNRSERWLLAASHQFTNDLNPQILLYGKEGSAPETGLNVSSLVNHSTVAFLEWAGGRAPTLVAQALGETGPQAYRNRASLGITYTTEFNLSVTLEHEQNSAGLDQSTLARVSAYSPLALLGFLEFTQQEQDLPTRRAEFVYASWQDCGIKHLDLSGFVRFDPISHGRTTWLETRYHFDQADLALQWQMETGRPQSVFGAIPTEREIQILLRWFL